MSTKNGRRFCVSTRKFLRNRRGVAQNIRLAMAFQNSVILALVLASNPAHALDLKKELERLRGGADAKETQTHATSADAVGRAAPAAAASLGRAAFLDASRVAPPLSRLSAIVKPRVGINLTVRVRRFTEHSTHWSLHRSSPETPTPSSATRTSTRRPASRASASAATARRCSTTFVHATTASS